MSLKSGISLPRLPNLHFYSETVKSRQAFTKQDRELSLSRRRADDISMKKERLFEDNSGFPNGEASFNPELSQRKMSVGLADRKKVKKYYQILNEIEDKAIKDYEKLKENRAKSSSKSNPVLPRKKLREIKEVPTREEFEEISCLLENPKELLLEESFQDWELEKVNRYLKERIEGELSQPIMDRPLFKSSAKTTLNKGEIRMLREKNRVGKEIEDILGRERLFYVKRLENFLKKRELPV